MDSEISKFRTEFRIHLCESADAAAIGSDQNFCLGALVGGRKEEGGGGEKASLKSFSLSLLSSLLLIRIILRDKKK